jgi:hypothetical protein
MTVIMFNLKMALAFMIGLASFGNPPDRTAYNIHEITLGAKAATTLHATRTPAGFMIVREYVSSEGEERGEAGFVLASKKVESKVTETITVEPSPEPLKFNLIEPGEGAQPNGRTVVDLSTLFTNIKDMPLSKEGMHVLRLTGPDGKDVEICVARFENMVVIQQKGATTAYCIQPAANKPLEATR